MGETLKQRIYRMGQDKDVIIQAYASDIIEILDEQEKKIKYDVELIRLMKSWINILDKHVEDNFDFSKKCGCTHSGSGGTLEICDYHKTILKIERLLEEILK